MNEMSQNPAENTRRDSYIVHTNNAQSSDEKSVASPKSGSQTGAEINQFICSIRHKYFTRPRNLKTHKLIHSGEKPYICILCYKLQFAPAGSPKAHMYIHTGEKSYSRENC